MAPEIRPAPFTRPEPAPATRRPYLVFMRVGATDLLPDWLAAEPERNWDVFVSGYAPREPQPGAVATVIGGYNKLSHFRECVQSGALDLLPTATCCWPTTIWRSPPAASRPSS